MSNYQLLKNWPDLPTGFITGNPTGIGIDSHQHIFIFHRANRAWTSAIPMPDTFISPDTIIMLDRDSGKIINSWGGNHFIMPHGLTVDRHDNIWVTDVGSHQVFKFTHDGELLMTLGEANIPGNDSTHFKHPTDIAVAKDGSFYVSDGYGNSRIVKFSSTGEYLFEWGRKGNKAGEFNIPHAIELDDEENVYVADRENNRIQVFNSAGNFIKQWAQESFGKINSIAFNKVNKSFLAIDYTVASTDAVIGSTIIFFHSAGNFIKHFDEEEGLKCWYHNVMIDDHENIYVTDILNNKIRKYKHVS